MTRWTGLKINNEARFSDTGLLICEKEIVLTFDKENVNLAKLFERAEKIEKLKITERFIVFINSNFIIQKKKIKKEALNPLNFENFIRLIEGMDEAVFYTNKGEIKKLIGLEWRLEEEVGKGNKIIRMLAS